MTGAEQKHPRLLLVACILASSLSFVDGSVVNVGLPAIGRDLHAGAADLQWAVNAYLLPLSALLLIGGAAGDRYGRKALLMVGTALFGAASLACALSPSLPWLLGSRAAQGVGAAVLLPNSLAILGSAFRGEARGRAIGIWAAMGAVMGAIGPVLGGWLIDTVGWRAIFLINLPLAAGAIAMAAAFIAESRDHESRPPLDLAGAALATASLFLATFGLTLGAGRGGWSAAAVGALATGLALGGGFVWVERLKGERAMTPLALFASRSFIGLTVLTLLLYGALGGMLVLIPYVVIEAAGYSGAQAGAALLPFAIILALASPVMGSIAGRIGSRLPLTVGPLVMAGGFLLLLRVGMHADYWTTVFPGVLVMAIGMAGAVAPLTNAVLSSVDERFTGAASGLNSAVARAGGLIATALLGGVLSAEGAALIGAFHIAMIACAAASVGAGLSALLLERRCTAPRNAEPRTAPES